MSRNQDIQRRRRDDTFKLMNERIIRDIEQKQSNMFSELVKSFMEKISFTKLISSLYYFLPEKFIEIIKTFGNTTYHMIMGIILLLITVFLVYVFRNKIVSMFGFLIIIVAIGVCYISISFNSQKKINKYTNLLDKLCSKENNKNLPECIEYKRIL